MGSVEKRSGEKKGGLRKIRKRERQRERERERGGGGGEGGRKRRKAERTEVIKRLDPFQN